jgi:hypothetical protein
VNEWLHRTNVGRVVYLRPKNAFHYRDTARILRNLALYYDADDIDNVFLTVGYAIDNLASRIYEEAKWQWDKIFSRLAGLSPAQALLVKLVRAIIDASRRYRAEYGITSVPWLPPKKAILNPWFPPDIVTQPTEVYVDPFPAEMLLARTLLTEYLLEVGYGQDE